MKRILLAIEHSQNRYLLSQWLAEQYHILSPHAEDDFTAVAGQMLEETFDLCFLDFGAVHHLRPKIIAKRKAAAPIFLPFIFLTTQQNVGLSTDHLEQLIDDLIYLPIKKIELETKLRVLLRSRSFSLQLKEVKEELNNALNREKELNQLKSSFVSMVSHEFRNPLNSISGMTQILHSYGDNLPPEKKAEVLAQLRRNVTKMTDLLNDVLTISRPDMGKLQFNPEPLDLEAFCRGLINEVQTVFHRHSIEFIYQVSQKEFAVDSKLLHHILINLLSNACKYSPEDSTVDFEVGNYASEISLIIRDRGIGIPPQDLPKLFDSFYRASNSKEFQGTGLGLAIAKQYVELHHGTITVESELAIGTTFKVIIPCG